MCEDIPVELLLATTDVELYKDRWLWDGPLYWAVECLPHGQTSVSDRVLPNVPVTSFMPIQETPERWNYCLSKACNRTSDTMQIIFTFNPASTDPKDYLQYVIDINGFVSDSPQHSITDSKGSHLYLNIVEVSKMIRQPYVEVWIARGNVDNRSGLTLTSKITIDKPVNWILPISILAGVLFLFIILLIILYFSF